MGRVEELDDLVTIVLTLYRLLQHASKAQESFVDIRTVPCGSKDVFWLLARQHVLGSVLSVDYRILSDQVFQVLMARLSMPIMGGELTEQSLNKPWDALESFLGSHMVDVLLDTPALAIGFYRIGSGTTAGFEHEEAVGLHFELAFNGLDKRLNECADNGQIDGAYGQLGQLLAYCLSDNGRNAGYGGKPIAGVDKGGVPLVLHVLA